MDDATHHVEEQAANSADADAVLRDSEREREIEALVTPELRATLDELKSWTDDEGLLRRLNDFIRDALLAAQEKGQRGPRCMGEYLCSVTSDAERSDFLFVTAKSLGEARGNDKGSALMLQWSPPKDQKNYKFIETQIYKGACVVVTIKAAPVAQRV